MVTEPLGLTAETGDLRRQRGWPGSPPNRGSRCCPPCRHCLGGRRWASGPVPKISCPGDGMEEGPVLLFPCSSSSSSSPSIFAMSDDPSPLQVSMSILLTGVISVFPFRSLHRCAKRAKEMRVRSMSVTMAKGLKEEAMESLKAMGSASIQLGAPPSPVQAFLGGRNHHGHPLQLYDHHRGRPQSPGHFG